MNSISKNHKMKYNLEKLQAAFRKGKKLKYIFFWKPEEFDPGCLSQWWKSGFIIDGVKYSSAEQYMMAQKALLFNDKPIYKEILQARSPMQFKQLGRKIKGFKEDIWQENREKIVFDGNLAKFSQNPDLKEYLLSTRNKILVEASPFDSIWGISLADDNENIKNPLKWKGQNLLGFVLMEVRDLLKLS